MADTPRSEVRPLPRWSRLPLAVCAGVIMALGMAPYDLWYVALFGLIGAFWLFLAAPKGIYAVGTGWAVGVGYFGFALGWIVEPFMVDVAATGWMAPFALLGMAAGLSLFWALPFWGAGHARKYPLAALVLAWAAAELARAYVFTGFPWGMITYFWAPVAAIQWVSVLGPHGLTLVTLVLAAFAASCIWDRAPWQGAIAATGMAVLLLGGVALTPPIQDLTGQPMVRLIQPNAPQREKWQPDKVQRFFDRQIAFSAAPGVAGGPRPALIIWPETAVPYLLNNAGAALGRVVTVADGAAVVLGIQREEAGRYFNSMIYIDGEGTLRDIYDKHHLVPFGEYMPAAAVFERWNILGLAARAEAGYSAGPGPAMLQLDGLGKALPLICYEAVFPQDVYRAPERPDMLLQITNDAWFGEWSGPYQHLVQARIRAIEQGLPMLRSANTGVSVVLDGAGRTIKALPLGKAGFVDAPLPPPLRVTLYSRVGDLPILVLLFLFSGALLWADRRKSD